MNITEDQMKIGQVKSIKSNGGTSIDFVELLFSSNTKAKFNVNRENNSILFTIEDTDLNYQSLNCEMLPSTVRDLIINLNDLYRELSIESEDK